jgi:hypothetical protein
MKVRIHQNAENVNRMNKDKANEKPVKNVKTILSQKIDIKGGKLTYGQRIDLGIIFQASATRYETVRRVFECLHEYTPCIEDSVLLTEYFNEAADGLRYWVEQEKLLKYEPALEEIRAGILSMFEEIGEFGTVKAIAKAYHIDPDDVLKWQYGKVFGILYTDMKELRFNRSLNKVLETKYRKK